VCEHHKTCGQYIVNREDVSHCCFMYLYFVSPFFYCLLNYFLLHQYPNYMVECDYPFKKNMQKGGVTMLFCTFAHSCTVRSSM
jgi:hypothetical protein